MSKRASKSQEYDTPDASSRRSVVVRWNLHSVHLVTLFEEEFRQVGAVLAGNAC